MSTPYRDIVDAVVTAIGNSGISNVSAWSFHREEPIYLQAVGQHCAVWFDGFQLEENNGTSGDLEMVCRFLVRYWEPAPEQITMVVDESAASTVESIMDSLIGVIFDNETGIGTSYQTWIAAGAKFVSRPEEGKAVRGCDLVFTCRLRRNFT